MPLPSDRLIPGYEDTLVGRSEALARDCRRLWRAVLRALFRDLPAVRRAVRWLRRRRR